MIIIIVKIRKISINSVTNFTLYDKEILLIKLYF